MKLKRLALGSAIAKLTLARDYLSYFREGSTNNVELMSINPEPTNLLWGYGYSSFDPLVHDPAMEHLGFEVGFNLDLAVGYRFLL